MTTSSRERALDAALDLARAGAVVSLDSVAAAAGLTKAGLVHHVRTKEALMLALVDRVVDRWEDELRRRLPVPQDRADAHQRLRAYVGWALSGDVDESDVVMLGDPRLRPVLTRRWAERIGPWCAVPADVPHGQRTRMSAARLLADGGWFADATATLPLDASERRGVLELALGLLEQDPGATGRPTPGAGGGAAAGAPR